MRSADQIGRTLRVAIAALPLACGGASKEQRPTVLHEMPAPEIARCAPGAPPPKGSFEVDQLVTEQGDVPAAWVRGQKVQEGGQLFRCATRLATDAKYPVQKADSVRTSRISCDGTTCQRADLAEARSPLDEKLAQSTLHAAGWATAAERGWGQLLVRDWPGALKQFGKALKERPGDVRALRGQAAALVGSGGDLARARAAAQKAVQLRPDSPAARRRRGGGRWRAARATPWRSRWPSAPPRPRSGGRGVPRRPRTTTPPGGRRWARTSRSSPRTPMRRTWRGAPKRAESRRRSGCAR